MNAVSHRSSTFASSRGSASRGFVVQTLEKVLNRQLVPLHLRMVDGDAFSLAIAPAEARESRFQVRVGAVAPL